MDCHTKVFFLKKGIRLNQEVPDSITSLEFLHLDSGTNSIHFDLTNNDTTITRHIIMLGHTSGNNLTLDIISIFIPSYGFFPYFLRLP